MDLGAYAQIKDIEKIAKENGIVVPRLRGYRLMKNEEQINYLDLFNNIEIECVEHFCEAIPFWSNNPEYWELSEYTDYIKHLFLDYEEFNPKRVRWDRIHGWKRRRLKLAIHNQKKRIATQYDTWNKYVGREDILYIHARIGGNNWPYYFREVVNEPWFIEKVDDSFDCTYCDIYARIKIKEKDNTDDE